MPGTADGFAPDEHTPMGQQLVGLGLPLGSPDFGCADVIAAVALLTSRKPLLLWGAPTPLATGDSETSVLMAALWELQSHHRVVTRHVCPSKGLPVTDALAGSGKSRRPWALAPRVAQSDKRTGLETCPIDQCPPMMGLWHIPAERGQGNLMVI